MASLFLFKIFYAGLFPMTNPFTILLLTTTINMSMLESQSYKSTYFFDLQKTYAKEQMLPFTDSTNFNNSLDTNYLPSPYLSQLQLGKVYPQLNERMFHKIRLKNYIQLPEKITAFIITNQINEKELESIIVTYSKTYDLIDFTQLAYDEIAEGFLRKTSVVTKEHIITTTFDYTSEQAKETKDTLWISDEGKFKIKKAN